MFLLVIGLITVIVAVLVAVFLVARRRGDDEEPGGRLTVRDRLGGRSRDSGWGADPREAWKTAGRGAGLSRRPAGEPRGYGGPDRDYERAGFDQSPGYEPSPRGYGARPTPGRDRQRTERIPAARRGAGSHDTPEPAAPAGSRAPRAATAPRRGAVGADTGPGAALYDTGPSAMDFATTRIDADPDLADSDVFPRVRAEIPETEAKARPRNQPKGRGRPSRGRHDDDDDDWPSTEWDKLSDEQYWAELSADKPLATTARSAQSNAPVPAPKPAPAARPARSGAQPPVPGRAASRPQPAPDSDLDSLGLRQTADRAGRPSGRQGAPLRADSADTDPGRPGLASRPGSAAQATERLPARNRHEDVDAALPSPVPPGAAPFMPAAQAGVQPGARSQSPRARG
ncbi:MAG: hypothetical protein ACLP5E_07965, partial [Streptosporangiaceae bacterium]